MSAGVQALPVSVCEIVRVVAADYGVADRHVYGGRRDLAASEARQVACWIAFDLKAMSSTEIAQIVGRDSSTVRHSAEQVELKRDRDPAFRARTDALHDCVALIGKRELVAMLADPDPVEVAERVARNPLHEAMRVSTLETAAMAVRLIELEQLAGATFQLLARHDREKLMSGDAALAHAAGTHELITAITEHLAALGYETTEEAVPATENSNVG